MDGGEIVKVDRRTARSISGPSACERIAISKISAASVLTGRIFNTHAGIRLPPTASFSPSGNFILITYFQTGSAAGDGCCERSMGNGCLPGQSNRCQPPPRKRMEAAHADYREGHDGVTDIYGLLFTPTHLDSGRKYPVIDYILSRSAGIGGYGRQLEFQCFAG